MTSLSNKDDKCSQTHLISNDDPTRTCINCGKRLTTPLDKTLASFDQEILRLNTIITYLGTHIEEAEEQLKEVKVARLKHIKTMEKTEYERHKSNIINGLLGAIRTHAQALMSGTDEEKRWSGEEVERYNKAIDNLISSQVEARLSEELQTQRVTVEQSLDHYWNKRLEASAAEIQDSARDIALTIREDFGLQEDAQSIIYEIVLTQLSKDKPDHIAASNKMVSNSGESATFKSKPNPSGEDKE